MVCAWHCRESNRPSKFDQYSDPDRFNATALLGSIHAAYDVANLAYSILECIAFQFFDSFCAQFTAGVLISDIFAVGGETRSKFSVRLMATLFDNKIKIPKNGEVLACPGATRLAHAAVPPTTKFHYVVLLGFYAIVFYAFLIQMLKMG